MDPFIVFMSAYMCDGAIECLNWLFVGLRWYVGKKPFVLPSHWCKILSLALWAGASLVVGISAMHSDGIGTTLLLLCMVLFVSKLAALWRNPSGHDVYGITDQSFREGLVASLKSLGLPYEEGETQVGGNEERITVIRLPTIQADLKEIVRSDGSGSLRIEQRKLSLVRTEILIARRMAEYYRNSESVSISRNAKGWRNNMLAGAAFIVLYGLLFVYIIWT